MSAWTFSATDRVFACPSSAALPQAHSLDSSDAADWGTGVHLYLRDCAVIGIEAARKALPKKAAWKACCLALDVSALLGSTRRAEWTLAYDVQSGESRDYGCDLGREYPDLGPSWLVGTLDLVVVGPGGSARAYDYKTGHTPPRAHESGQLLLGALAVASHLALDSITVGIISVREDGSHHVDEYTYEPWDLDEGREQVRAAWHKVQAAKALVIAGQVPNVTTGSHCRYCPAFAACPAQNALALSLSAEARVGDGNLAHTANFNVGLMSAKQAGEAWEQLHACQRILDAVERALKARVDHDGSLPLPDGSSVSAISVTRESIDAERAIPALASLWAMPEVSVAGQFEPRITKAELDRVCRELGTDPKTALGALRSVGAVPSIETTSYRTTKKKEKAA